MEFNKISEQYLVGGSPRESAKQTISLRQHLCGNCRQ